MFGFPENVFGFSEKVFGYSEKVYGYSEKVYGYSEIEISDFMRETNALLGWKKNMKQSLDSMNNDYLKLKVQILWENKAHCWDEGQNNYG